MAVKKIPPMDLMFFLTETAYSPKHVGAVQIFKKPRNAPKNYMRDLVSAMKAATVEPPFNYRPYFPRFGLPEWHVDDNLDIDYHVRHSALPEPGTDAVLMEVLQRLHSGMLKRDRPGWICQIIEGLEGGRFAVYTKVHHAYIDGMSGVQRMYGSMSTSPKEMKVVPNWAYVPKKKPSKQSRSKKSGGGKALAQAKAMAELYSSAARRGLGFFNLRESEAQEMFRAPRTRMNDRVEYDTRSIALCSLPLDTVRDVSHYYGAKVNDTILAVIDSALHDYLEFHGENISAPLVALCPMSVREKGDETASTQATILHIRLGSPEVGPQERLQQIIDSSNASKEKARTMSGTATMNLAMIMVGALELADRTTLGSFFSPSYNVLISNVPGPSDNVLYLRGSKQLGCYLSATLNRQNPQQNIFFIDCGFTRFFTYPLNHFCPVVIIIKFGS